MEVDHRAAASTMHIHAEMRKKKKTGIVRVTFQGLVLPDQCMSGIADEAVISKGGCKFTILPQGSGHADKGVVSCPV